MKSETPIPQAALDLLGLTLPPNTPVNVTLSRLPFPSEAAAVGTVGELNRLGSNDSPTLPLILQ